MLPVLDHRQGLVESNVYTISVKTTQISDSSEKNTLDIHVSIIMWVWVSSLLAWQMTFANGKTHQQVLSSSETHQIAFQKDHVDFFLVSLDNIGDSTVRPVSTRQPEKAIQSIIDRMLLSRLPMSKLVYSARLSLPSIGTVLGWKFVIHYTNAVIGRR
jgi:hypothetical protein